MQSEQVMYPPLLRCCGTSGVGGAKIRGVGKSGDGVEARRHDMICLSNLASGEVVWSPAGEEKSR